MRILVTGGAGYIGSVLCERLLEAGHQVTVLDSLMHGHHGPFHLCANPCFDFIRGDARDPELMRRAVANADVLVPLAALVGAPICDRDPWAARMVNFEAVRLLNKLRSPRQLVHLPDDQQRLRNQVRRDVLHGGHAARPDFALWTVEGRGGRELLGSPNVITLRLATVLRDVVSACGSICW